MARPARRWFASSALPSVALLAGWALAAAGAAAAPPLSPWAIPDGVKSHPSVDGGPCPGPIDDLVEGDAVDLGKRGFALRKLGPGYGLEAFGTRSEGLCDGHGGVADPVLIASTQWLRLEGGERFLVGQREAPEPVANVLESSWSSFWSDGYGFDVYLWEPYYAGPVPAAGAAPTLGPGQRAFARLLPPTARAPRQQGPPAAPPLPRPAAAKDAARDRLLEVIAALAPELDPACFHSRVEGGWPDLAGLEIGDPRPAVPAGWAEASFYLSFYQPPASACGGPAPPWGAGVGLLASWSGADGGWISVSASSRVPSSPPSPGYVDDSSAYWSNDSYQLSVWVSTATGAGNRALVVALATALDPGFSLACLLETRPLTPQEAVARGFHLAQPPSGYQEVASQLWSQSASPACDDPPPPSYAFYWSFSDGGNAIDAWLYRTGDLPAAGTAEKSGWLSWTDAAGTSYSIAGYAYDGGAGPPEELLLEVARSMDPTFPAP